MSGYTPSDVRDRGLEPPAAEVDTRGGPAWGPALFDRCPDALFVIGADGRIVEANATACERLGCARPQLLGQPIGTVDLALQADTFGSLWRQMLVDRRPRVRDGLHRCRDGTAIRVEMHLGPVERDGVLFVLASARSVAQRPGDPRFLLEGPPDGRQILDVIQEICVHYDRDLRIRWASRAAGEVAGRSAGDLVGRRCDEIWQEGHEVCQQCPVRQTSESGAVHEGEVQTPDGRRWWLRAHPLLDGEGRVAGVIAVGQDITGRRQAEEALRHSEQLHRALVAAVPDAMTTTDLEGRITYASPRAAVLHGYDGPDGMIGLHGLEVVAPADRERARADMTALRDGGPAGILEYQLLRRDGTTFPAEVSAAVLRDAEGQPRGIVSVTRDLTERRRTEQALRDSERRLRAIFDHHHQLTGLLDTAGRVLAVNRAAMALVGQEEAQVVGRPFWQTPWWRHSEPLRERVRAAVAVAASGAAVRFDATHVDAEGRTHHIDFSLNPVRDEDGRVVYLVPEGRDFTQVKQAEDALRETEEQLRQSQKMEAVGQLAGGVAHDFRNQLTVIRGYVELLLRRKLIQAQGRGMLEEVIRAVDRSTQLTTQLLAFSRRQMLEPRVVDVSEWVADMARTLGRMIGEDVRLMIDYPEEPCWAEVDPAQLQQALMNLAGNARDAMPCGGELHIRTRGEVVDEAFARSHADAVPGSYVVVSVSDTGRGMDAGTLGRIFEPFFTTKGVGEGSGLGLAMVYGFVRQSGGFVEARSEPGAGTTIRLCFPQSPPPADAPHSPPTSAAGPTPQPAADAAPAAVRVLVVEDEDALRRLIVRFLRGAGYGVLEAEGPEQAEALALERGEPFDVLVTDVIMPHVSGVQLAQRLRARRPDLPVVYVSGYAGRELARHGLDHETGHDRLLVKPFQQHELLTAVRAALRGPAQA